MDAAPPVKENASPLPPSNSSSLTSEGFSSTVTCLWSSTPRGGALSELRFAESLLLILCKATKRS